MYKEYLLDAFNPNEIFAEMMQAMEQAHEVYPATIKATILVETAEKYEEKIGWAQEFYQAIDCLDVDVLEKAYDNGFYLLGHEEESVGYEIKGTNVVQYTDIRGLAKAVREIAEEEQDG